MIVTEAEAATMWCPFARVALNDKGPAANRWHKNAAEAEAWTGATCVGRRCMMWMEVYRPHKTDPTDVAKGECGMVRSG